ncbi:MAG TPA: hypothetical protein VK421_18130 [Pyrinomonadaceae bacterium]|nr:hypothetical protein [Pyrinomonadaceae bacterium]
MTNLTIATFLAFIQAAAPAAAREQQAGQVLTGGGWLFMSMAWVFILVLVYFTFSKVLLAGRKK